MTAVPPLLAALLTTTMLLGGTADAEAPSSPSPAAAMAGTSVIGLPAPAGEALVILPQDVQLPGMCLNSTAVAVDGTADAAVVRLQSLADPSDDGAALFGRLPGGAHFDDRCSRRTLSAGRYRLTALRTEGTATVTLSLPGLEGRTSLTAIQASSAALKVLPMVTTNEASTASAAHGAKLELKGKGTTTVVGRTTTTFGGSAIRATCHYGPETAAILPPEVLYLPPCPGAGSSRGLGLGGDSLTVGTTTDRPAGTYGLGFYYIGAGELRSTAIAATFPNA